jgi:hypothetical protein
MESYDPPPLTARFHISFHIFNLQQCHMSTPFQALLTFPSSSYLLRSEASIIDTPQTLLQSDKTGWRFLETKSFLTSNKETLALPVYIS